jgi:hypothetical protein
MREMLIALNARPSILMRPGAIITAREERVLGTSRGSAVITLYRGT